MKIKYFLFSICLLMNSSFVSAIDKNRKIDMRELALPSDLKGITKVYGAVYYNTSIKGKALIPVHIWGAVGVAGLHFVPLDTTIIKGLSFAGGPSRISRLDNIRLSRLDKNKKLTNKVYDLSEGGKQLAFSDTLQPGDTLFVSKDYYREDRVYYTSLISVIVSLLSGILIYREVRNNR